MASEASKDSLGTSLDRSEFRERIEELEERNRKLETENERLRSVTGPRVTYRQGVVLCILVAAAAMAGTLVYPGSRDVLIALAGTGMFGAVLLGMLVQGWFLSASVSRAIYDTLWENETRIAARLGVDEVSRYVPTEQESLGVRLYLSRSPDDPIPSSERMGSTVVNVDGHYTLLLEPTGQEFVDIFEHTIRGLPDDVQIAAATLCEAVVQQFELAQGAEVIDTELSTGTELHRLRIRVWGSILGDATRFDHPIRSFIGVAMARIVETPVESETLTGESENAVLVFRWENESSDRGALKGNREDVPATEEIGNDEDRDVTFGFDREQEVSNGEMPEEETQTKSRSPPMSEAPAGADSDRNP